MTESVPKTDRIAVAMQANRPQASLKVPGLAICWSFVTVRALCRRHALAGSGAVASWKVPQLPRVARSSV